MKTRKIIFLLVALWGGVQGMQAQENTKGFIDKPYIEVIGTAEQEIVPDEIYLKIVLQEKDSKGKSTVESQEKVMMTALQQAEIEVEKQLRIQDAVSDLKTYWLKGNTVVARREYVLLLPDAGKLGKVFRELERLEISNVSVQKVSHSRLKEFRLQVKVAAIQAARQKAERLAGAIQQRIGHAIYIQEMEWEPRPYFSNVAVRTVENAAGEEGNVEFEKIRLQASVRVCFELY